MLARQVSLLKERLEHLERELAGLATPGPEHGCECQKG
jgi:hypothetical protein